MRNSSSVLHLFEVVACLLVLGSAQNFDVTYYTDSLGTAHTVHKTNEVLGTCNDVTSRQGTRGYKIICASATSESANYAPTALLINVDNAGCGTSAAAATHWYQLPISNQLWHIQGDVQLWMRWNYPSGGSSLCGETVPTLPVPPTIAGDPVTWYGDVREEFNLPIGELTPLLQSPHMHVHASARAGHAEDQWIDRILITSPFGEPVLDVSIKQNLTHFNRAALVPNAFETLDVKMEWWRDGLLHIMPPGDAQFNHWSGVSLGFGRIRHHGQPLPGLEPRREAVVVMSPSLKILILSSSAREYFLKPEKSNLAMDYSHLDFELLELGDTSNLRGVLPELWGLIPHSEKTKSLRKEPSNDHADGPTFSTIAESFPDSGGNETASVSKCSAATDGETPQILIPGISSCSNASDVHDDVLAKHLSQAGSGAVASVDGYSGGRENLPSDDLALLAAL